VAKNPEAVQAYRELATSTKDTPGLWEAMHDQVRTARVQELLDHVMPAGADKAAMFDQLRTAEGRAALVRDTRFDAPQTEGPFLKELARIQEVGRIQGDYVKHALNGDWLIAYGDKGIYDGANRRGVEAFDTRGEAMARRAELRKGTAEDRPDLAGKGTDVELPMLRSQMKPPDLLDVREIANLDAALDRRGVDAATRKAAHDAYAS
jgi:hypothetical protein